MSTATADVTEKVTDAAGAMDWLTFIASVIGSVAWPISAVIIALVFRKHLVGLLSRVRKLSLGDTSVDFAERLVAAEAVVEAAAVTSNAPPEQSKPSVPDDRLTRLIEISPSAAVLDVWRSIERQVFERASALPIEPDVIRAGKTIGRRPSFQEALRSLLRYEAITPSTYAVLLDLQRMRNDAAHSGLTTALAPSDAVRFMSLAAQVGMYPESGN